MGDLGHDRGLEITGGCRGRGSLVGGRAPLPAFVLQHQVVGQPRQKPCPGDLADAAQLQALGGSPPPAAGSAVLGVRREPETDLGLDFGRRRLRERRDGQFFGLAVAAGPVEPLHRLGDQ